MSDLVGWAQTGVAAAAIVASGLISTWTVQYGRSLERKENNRRRLDITTKRWPPAGLQLDLRYLPEFTHVGMFARIKLISPPGAILKGMIEVGSVAATHGNHTRLQVDGPFVGGEGVVRLKGHGTAAPYTGSMLILPPLNVMSAPLTKGQIAVSIETDAGETLLKTDLDISPTDEIQSFWETSPPEGSSPV